MLHLRIYLHVARTHPRVPVCTQLKHHVYGYLHKFPQKREISTLMITVDVGGLVNWRFNDMSTMTRWVRNLVDSHVWETSLELTKPFIQVTSDSLDNIKYEMGTTKKPLTKEEAADLGAGIFNMRYLHTPGH